jgi:hypothetical protein
MKQYCEIKFQVIYELNQTENEQWYNIIYSAIIPQPFTTEVSVSSGVSVCEICGENSGTICPILWYYLNIQYNSTSTPHSYLYHQCYVILAIVSLFLSQHLVQN